LISYEYVISIITNIYHILQYAYHNRLFLQTIDCKMIGLSVTVNNFICISSISDEELEDKYEIKKIDYTEIRIGIQRVVIDNKKML